MSLEWTNCFDCVYFEDCEEKESRASSRFGESIEDPLVIKIRTDRPEDWKPREFSLHTGEHSQ
jgi:hypothetical protein